MNYLAHAYLSFAEPQILAGNMISDFIKGKKQYEYASLIQKGIQLHRYIDTFTDTHAATAEIKKFFRPYYRLYAGAFTDIVYDYFLANDKNEFASVTALELFSATTYSILDKQLNDLPPAFQEIFPYMKKYDWLSNYRHQPGIQKSFAGMVSRAKYISDADTAFKIFVDNIEIMRPYYDDFFPLLKKNSLHILDELLNR